MNEILIKRICQLIAITYALKLEDVYELYLRLNSIDKVLEQIQNEK